MSLPIKSLGSPLKGMWGVFHLVSAFMKIPGRNED